MSRSALFLYPYRLILMVTIGFAANVQADSVSYPINHFSAQEVLSADKLNGVFNDIRGVVNGNDSSKQNAIINSCSGTQSIQSIAPNGATSCIDPPTGGTYSDQMARDAMGLKDNTGAGNPYNHDRFDPGVKNNTGTGNPFNHDRFDPGVKSNVGAGNPFNHDRFDPGVKNNVGIGNPYNHDRFDPGVKNNVGAGNPLNHDRFDPGLKDNIGVGNPYNHDRYSDADAVSAIKANDGTNSGLDADMLDGLDSSSFVQGNQSCSVGSMVGINASGAVVCQISNSVTTVTLAQSALLGAAYTDVTSINVLTPQPGAVHVSATGIIQLTGKIAGQYSSVYVGISGTANAAPAAGNHIRFFLSNDVPTGTYEIPFSVQAVFPAATATTYSAHLVAENNGLSGDAILFQSRVVATYHKD